MTINPGGSAYSHTYRSDAPPPAKLRVSGASLLLPGASVGTAALLLPAAVRFFSESLPHLLPRQAFSFSGPRISRTQSRASLFVLLQGSGADDSCLNFEGRDEVPSQTLRQGGRPGGSSLRFAPQRCIAGDRESRFSPKRGEGESSSGRISPVDRSSCPSRGCFFHRRAYVCRGPPVSQ